MNTTPDGSFFPLCPVASKGYLIKPSHVYLFSYLQVHTLYSQLLSHCQNTSWRLQADIDCRLTSLHTQLTTLTERITLPPEPSPLSSDHPVTNNNKTILKVNELDSETVSLEEEGGVDIGSKEEEEEEEGEKFKEELEFEESQSFVPLAQSSNNDQASLHTSSTSLHPSSTSLHTSSKELLTPPHPSSTSDEHQYDNDFSHTHSPLQSQHSELGSQVDVPDTNLLPLAVPPLSVDALRWGIDTDNITTPVSIHGPIANTDDNLEHDSKLDDTSHTNSVNYLTTSNDSEESRDHLVDEQVTETQRQYSTESVESADSSA